MRGTMSEGEILHGPRLRHAAIITVIGCVMNWGVPFASFSILPGTNLGFLFVASFGELVFLVWLIGWGTRLREPAMS